MKIILRILAVIVVFILVIIVAGFIAGHFLINSSNIKKMLAERFYQYTGHTLTIKDLSFSVFPTTRLEIKDASINNAPGFGKQPLASLKEVDAGVKILPLFNHKIETTGFTIEGLHLNLQVNKAGDSNWAGLTSAGQSTSNAVKQIDKQSKTRTKIVPKDQVSQHKASSSASSVASISIPSIEIKDISVNYNNQHNGESFALNKVNFQASNVTNDEYFPFKLAINYQKSSPATKVNVDSSGQALFSPQDSLVKLKGVNFDSNVTKNNIPVRFRFSDLATTIKFPQQGIIIKPLTAKLYQGQFSGQAKLLSSNKSVNITTSGQLTAVDLTALLKDLSTQNKFSGQGDISYSLRTQGTKGPEFIRHLNGSGAIKLTQVQFKGFDLGYEYRNGLNLLKHGKQLNKPHGNVTKFGHLNGHYTISNGVVNLRKLKLTSPILVVDANGLINLNNQKLKLRIEATGMQGSLGNLRPYGPTIPFDVKGTINHPLPLPDLGALTADYLQAKIQKTLQNLSKSNKNKFNLNDQDNKGKLNLNDLGKLFGH